MKTIVRDWNKKIGVENNKIIVNSIFFLFLYSIKKIEVKNKINAILANPDDLGGFFIASSKIGLEL